MNKNRVFITGVNGALGFETAKRLIEEGVDSITLAARTQNKADEVHRRLTAETKTQTSMFAVGGFDNTDVKSLNTAANKLKGMHPFNVIFFQAGGAVFSKDYQYISHNKKYIEKTVFQNLVSSYITLMNLKKHHLIADNARIVFIGGENARGVAGMNPKPTFNSAKDFEDFITGKEPLPRYNPMYTMGISKLAIGQLVQKLSQLNDGNDYIWFSPGLTHGSNGFASAPLLKRLLIEKIVFPISANFGISQTPKQGAEKNVDVLLGRVGRNGDILGVPQHKLLGKATNQKPFNAAFTDPDLINKLWSLLEDMV